MNWMEFVGSLVSSVAWPVAAVIFALLLRRPLTRTLRQAVLRRLKAGPGGVELEWDRTLQEAQTELAEEAPPPGIHAEEALGETELDFLGDMRQLARISPEAAVMESYRRLEQELRPPLEQRPAQQRLRPQRSRSLRALARQALQAEILRPRDLAVLDDLSALRNAVSHHALDLDEQRALAYADLAWDALNTIVARLRNETEEGG